MVFHYLGPLCLVKEIITTNCGSKRQEYLWTVSRDPYYKISTPFTSSLQSTKRVPMLVHPFILVQSEDQDMEKGT